MTALRLLAPLALFGLLTGCYEFAGDLEKLGFSSNLVVGAGDSWTPEYAVAADSVVQVTATRRLDLGEESGEPPLVTASVGGDLSLVDQQGGLVWLSGTDGDRGVVRWRGEVRDRFSVRFAAPTGAWVEDPIYEMLPVDIDLSSDRIALLPDSEQSLRLVLTDATGAPLGWSPEDLEVVEDGGVSAWMDGATLHVAASDGGGSVTVVHGGIAVDTIEVLAVTAADVHALDVHVWDEVSGGQAVTLAVATAHLRDGTPVYGLSPRWSWDGGPAEEVDRGDALLVPGGATSVRASLAEGSQRPSLRR